MSSSYVVKKLLEEYQKTPELTEKDFLEQATREGIEWNNNFWRVKNSQEELDIHSPEFLRKT